VSSTGRDHAVARARQWEEMRRTARAVSVRPGGEPWGGAPGVPLRRRRLAATTALAAGLSGVLLGITTGRPQAALADSTVDADLFALTNQDRTANGVGALRWNGTLASIADSRPYPCGGGTAYGRALDMLRRGYFAHEIPECGNQYADIMLTPDGLQWSAWAENIEWRSGGGDPASVAAAMNQGFMTSPEHRANILDGTCNQMGTGSELGSFQGYGDAWMVVEEFMQGSGGSAPRPPAPLPHPRPVPPPVRVPAPAPAPPRPVAPPPAATAVPAPAPAASPAPSPLAAPVPEPAAPAWPGAPAASAELTAAIPPLLDSSAGLLADTVEGVLEAHLLD
jgi:uncharacterized protein YkwD